MGKVVKWLLLLLLLLLLLQLVCLRMMFFYCCNATVTTTTVTAIFTPATGASCDVVVAVIPAKTTAASILSTGSFVMSWALLCVSF